MKKIESIKQLKNLAQREKGCDCFIALNGGLRSSKYIKFENGIFYIFNEIDDTEQELTEDELQNVSITNIGKAINLKSLYLY